MTRIRFALLVVLSAMAACGDEGPSPSDRDLALPLETASPFEAGLDVVLLSEGLRDADRIERLRSLVVVHRGKLLVERYYGTATVDSLADVRSVTKSIVGTLTGVAVAGGAIESLDQPITDFLTAPDYPVSERHEDITVRHLLTMASGFDWLEAVGNGYNDWIFSGDHVAYLLDREISSEPGTVFSYNSAAVHLLGRVVEEAVGRSLASYADDVLFGPLGIEQARWEPLGDGAVNGGAGIDLRPRDLARIGMLFAQDGRSGGRSIVPMDWVGEATSSRWPDLGGVNRVRDLSYGYLWWIDRTHGAFFAWGYGGQFIYVDPDLDLVMVATTDWVGVSQDIGPTALQQQVLDVMLGRFLPAVGGG